MIVNSVEEAVTLLNGLLEKDVDGISFLFLSLNTVAESIKDTPVEVMASPIPGNVYLPLLGFLNGFLSERDASGAVCSRISIEFMPQSRRVKRFYVEPLRGV